jgi:hypothetical protein
MKRQNRTGQNAAANQDTVKYDLAAKQDTMLCDAAAKHRLTSRSGAT